MQLSDILTQTGGLQSIARELGIDEHEATSAASALTPAILGGLKQQAQSHPQGMTGFGGLLNMLGGGSMLDAVVSSSPTDTTPGHNMLGQIFGSREATSAVVQNAAAQTGQDPSVLNRMLPMLAMVVGGYMAKQHTAAGAASGQSGGGLSSLLGGLFGGSAQTPPDSASNVLGSLSGTLRNPADEMTQRPG